MAEIFDRLGENLRRAQQERRPLEAGPPFLIVRRLIQTRLSCSRSSARNRSSPRSSGWVGSIVATGCEACDDAACSKDRSRGRSHSSARRHIRKTARVRSSWARVRSSAGGSSVREAAAAGRDAGGSRDRKDRSSSWVRGHNRRAQAHSS